MNIRILHLIPNLSSGGAERQLSYLAPELVRLGHDVHIAYSEEGPQNPELPGVMLHKIRSRSSYDIFLLWRIYQLIRYINPDIIHTWIPQMDVIGGIAARLNGAKCIFRESSSSKGKSGVWKHGLRFLVVSGVNAIISNSRGGDEYWKTQLPGSRRYVIPNGLPLDKIDCVVAMLPPELTEPTAPIVLYVGRMNASKNLMYLLEALACVGQRQKVLGIFCGEGPQRSKLEAFRHKLGLNADVHFTGYLPATSVWALMKKASVFVSLSAFEGQPNAVMEAMACGCPLVLSDIPAHREILDENCALFIDPFNMHQTAEAVIQILQNEDASKKRAMIARQKTQEWSIVEMAKNYERVYKEVILRFSPSVDEGSKPITDQ